MSFFATQRARLALTLFAACGIIYGNTASAQQKATDNSTLSIERNSDNTPSSITFSPSAGWRKGQEQEIFKKYLGVDGVNTTMKLQYSTTTKMGVTASRYTEYYKGIKVEYGSYTLTEKNGLIHFISGNHYNTSGLSTATSITEAAALNKALAYVGATKYMWQDPSAEENLKNTYNKPDTSYFPKAEMMWVADFVSGKDDRKLHLAYAFNVYAQAPRSRQMVYVDATTGAILHTNSLIKHTAATNRTLYSGVVPFVTSHISGPTYTLYDSTRGGGVYTRSVNHNTSVTGVVQINSTTNYWPAAAADTTAIDVHWGVEKVYDYWNTQQGRNSWDGAGGILLSYIHMNDATGGGLMDNAYWDGSEMCYGDGTGCSGAGAAGYFLGPVTSLDVTAHELGHGICQATANLVYASESGAINEGLSDCWGATVEHYADPHETDAMAKQYFKIGEEIGCGGAPLRSMDFPHNESNPDTYGTTDPFWVNVTGCTPNSGNDQCGVHTNSGVTNKWYYLVVSGGIGTNTIGNAYNVNAIGWTEAANILYQTELIMPSTCTYAQFRTNSINVATTLYGACSPEVQCVTNAWYAVGVGTAFVACTPQIGFTTTILNTTEYAGTATCPASRVINIGVKPSGNLITGGNPVVNVVVGHGTAVSGVDYTLTGTTLTFLASDTSTHYATLTLFDNGAVNDTKNLVLGFTLSAMGSTATISPTNDSMYITINNDDSAVLFGGNEYHTLNTGTAVTSNNSSAFSSNKRGHIQFLLYASEMTAAGVRPGIPISQLAFNITTKASTAAYVGYTVSMANSASVDLSVAFATGTFTTVFTGNHTTNSGIDSIPFTSNFTWDGTSNVAVNICWGANTVTFTGNDQMSGIDHGSTIVFDKTQSNTGTGNGCALAYSTGTNTARPVVRFLQKPYSKIATVLGNNHTWDVKAGTQVNFWNTPDTSIVATMNNETANLGCVTATVSAAGVGFTPAAFSSTVNRSLKQITITPTINGATTTYDATIYLTTTELNGVAPTTLYLLKTEQATDATINATNSTLLTPTLITGTNFTGFKGTFTGVTGSRFFLTDGPFCTPPTATVTATGSTTFCLGSSVTLNASTGAGYTYQWQNGTVNIPGATASSYTATYGGTYQVLITSGTCVGTSTVTTVSVDSAYAAPIGAATTTVCAGQTISLTDITPLGVWTSGNTAVATVTSTGVMTGVSAGTATLSYTVTNSCGAATATTTITVNASPVVAGITGTLTTCAGSVTTLNDATPSGTWSSNNTGVATVSGGVTTGVAAGSATISYSVTNGSGCTTVRTASVSVFALPVASITASGPTSFCSSSSVTLIANTGAGLSYQWQESGVTITGATNATFNTNVTGNYSVIITNLNNCSSTSNTIATTVNPGFTVTPSVSIAASPGTTLCLVSSVVNYTASSVNGGTSPVYNWYVNGTGISTGSTFSYTPLNGDVVKCMLTSSAACALPDTASATVTMTIMAPATPSVTINALPNDTVCAGTIATFAGIPSFGGTTPSYLWNKNGVNVATGPAYNYVPTNGDVLICRMISNYSCRSRDTAFSAPLTVTVDTNVINTVTVTANHTAAAPGTPIIFTATAPHAGTGAVYQWYVNGVPVAGVTTSTYTTTTLTSLDVVTCSVTSTLLCASPGTAYSTGVTVNVTNGIDNISGNNQFMLLPNPNNGTFTIKGTLVTNDDQIVIKVTDMLGQVVYQHTTAVYNNSVNETISLNQSLAAGVYMVNITSAGANAVFHVVVNK